VTSDQSSVNNQYPISHHSNPLILYPENFFTPSQSSLVSPAISNMRSLVNCKINCLKVALLCLVAFPQLAPCLELEIQVDKVVYLPGAPGLAKITIEDLPEPADSAVVKCWLEYGLTQRNNLPDIQVPFKDGKAIPVALKFTAPPSAWGIKLHAALYLNNNPTAAAWDVFAVGTNSYRLGQQANHGGALSSWRVKEFAAEDSYYADQWRRMKGTWLEIFGGLPSEFCGLTTEWDEWVTMQGRYRNARNTIRAYTTAARRLGLKVMIYNNATPSGWVGTRWARKHPEWLSYSYLGNMRADLNTLDVEKQKSWHKTLKPHATTAFHPIYLNFYDPKLTEFGCDQMLGACRDFGYDGVRFDGHWILGDVWSGLGYGMDGRRPNRGESLDAVNTRNLRHMKEYTWERKPDFQFGFNYGGHYATGGARNPRAYRMACANGGMILWEGSTFDEAYSDWRIGALKLRENALRVHQNGGVHYGQAYMIHSKMFSSNEFSLRYFFITNFAATSHIYAGVYPDHPHYLPIQGLYFRFALRYGELLFDPNLKPILNPEDHLSVTVRGEEREDPWWKPYTYKRQLDGRYQIITHLVNMPKTGVNKSNATPDKQPPPLEDVRIVLKDKPLRVFLLDPEEPGWQQDLEQSQEVSIPSLKAWKILVQEFEGSGADIAAEVIPDDDFRDRDRAPDPVAGRTVIPINYLITGAVDGGYYAEDVAGTRLVEDPQAEFGYALRCEANGTSGPKTVMSGPNHSMPIAAPGKTRVGFRLKVADNQSPDKVCTLTGRLGRHTIAASDFAEPGVYQEFTYDYQLREGQSNRVSLDYHGGTDLWIDRVMMQLLEPAIDRDFFPPPSLDVADLPARQGPTRRINVLRGLWHDFFGLDPAADRAGIQVTDSWEMLSTEHANIPFTLPVTVEELMGYDLMAMLNAGASSLQPVRRRNLREYVMRGGTLFVGGGALAFGHGGYLNTFLEEILPVEIHKSDLTEAVGNRRLIEPGNEHDIINGLDFSAQPRVAYYHDVQAKPEAEILLRAGSVPILSVLKIGRGKVYAMTGTPMGEVGEGTPWWAWDGWQTIMDRILADASPNVGVIPTPPAVSDSPLLARIPGSESFSMIDAEGNAIAPLERSGVTVTDGAMDFGYQGGKVPRGKLVFPGGVIKPYGSISFKITPGWETNLESIDRSVTLFQAGAPGEDSLHIWVFVYPMRSSDEVSIALACYVRSKDEGASDFTDHYTRYGLHRIKRGGLRMLQYTQWKQGEEREIKVQWSPSQIVIWDNGVRMTASDFAPSMDLHEINGPLHVGGSNGGTLSRVKMRDIEIRGKD